MPIFTMRGQEPGAPPVIVDGEKCLLVRLCPDCKGSQRAEGQAFCDCIGGFKVEPFATLDELKAKAV